MPHRVDGLSAAFVEGSSGQSGSLGEEGHGKASVGGVAENILTDILGDAADAGLSVTALARTTGLSRVAVYKRSAKTIDSMRHATQAGGILTPSCLTHAERTALGLPDE